MRQWGSMVSLVSTIVLGYKLGQDANANGKSWPSQSPMTLKGNDRLPLPKFRFLQSNAFVFRPLFPSPATSSERNEYGSLLLCRQHYAEGDKFPGSSGTLYTNKLTRRDSSSAQPSTRGKVSPAYCCHSCVPRSVTLYLSTRMSSTAPCMNARA